MKPLSEESRGLIAAAADAPPQELEARTWQALSERLEGPLSPMALAASQALEAASGARVLSGLGAKLAIGTAAVGALWGAGSALYGAHAPERASPLPSRTASSSLHAPAASAPAATPSRPATVTPSSQPAASTLSAELELVAGAQRALNGAAASEALALLEQHQTRFPRGELAQERDAARVLALCALGRSADARRERRRFAHDWPASPLLARVRGGCGER